jgi:hypothetical protein
MWRLQSIHLHHVSKEDALLTKCLSKRLLLYCDGPTLGTAFILGCFRSLVRVEKTWPGSVCTPLSAVFLMKPLIADVDEGTATDFLEL